MRFDAYAAFQEQASRLFAWEELEPPEPTLSSSGRKKRSVRLVRLSLLAQPA